MKVHEIGESGLIDRIRNLVEKKTGSLKQVVLSIGDDTAVIKPSKGKLLLATTDTLVDKVHFDSKLTGAAKIGHKAMVSNISDIIAMGGVPKYALVSLGLPGNSCVEFVDNLYRGMMKVAGRYGVAIVGGDTVESPRNLVITLTLLGEATKKQLVSRSGAEIGDKLLVTGTFGDSAAGLELLIRRNGKMKKSYRQLVKRHQEPEPRAGESRIIAVKGLATSMIDSSDGLDVSVRSICRESRVGARVYPERVPVSSALRSFTGAGGKADGDSALMKYAIYGGEDFELVFTVPESRLGNALKSIPGTRCIGEIVPHKSGIKYVSNGRVARVKGGSFKHFKKNN